MEEFNGVAGGVLEENLPAADSNDDLVAKMGSRLAQPLHGCGEVVDFDGKSIPPTRLGLGAIRHGLSASAGRIRSAKDETQIAAREHRKGRRRVHHKLKAKMLRIECNSGLHIVNDVADLNGCHAPFLSFAP